MIADPPPLTRDAHEAARAHIAEGGAGVDASRALADLADAQVRALLGDHPSVCAAAVGGYGRRELAPTSDLDLLFLTDDAAAAEPAVQRVLRGLWDLGYQVGFATRTVAETVALAADDLHTLTGLLTARPLAGAEDALHAVRAGVLADLDAGGRAGVLEALEAGMAARHARYGRSVYLLEPNLKQSPGGLRDLHTLWWSAAATFRVERLADLLPKGLLTARAVRELVAARDLLLEIRNRLHWGSGYAGDRLTFEHQAAIAAAMGFGDDRPAVERFMAAYYRHATAVQTWTRLVLDRCREEGRPARPRVARPIDDDLVVVDGHLQLTAPDRLQRDPTLTMRLFAVARREGVPLHGALKAKVIDQVAALEEDATWRIHPVVVESFLDVLTEPDDPSDALGELHETGMLGAVVPEFRAVTHRTHHDLYHVHTVDIHTLHAVRRLKALHRGALAEAEPLLTGAMQKVGDPVPLYLGLLMHDVGKALGRGHALKGARLVPAVARRLGLSVQAARDAEWLVRDHLLMAHLSQRRDLSDPELVRQFARQVGSEEALARLFVLTWADASTTGPQAYTDWKAALLAELYARGVARFRQGLDLYEDPKRRVARLRRAVTRWLQRNGDDHRVADVNGAVDHFFASLPTAYFERTRARTIARHLALLDRLEQSPPVAIEVNPRPRRGYSQLHVAARGRVGLLAAVCGVLSAHGLDIILADLHTTTDGRVLDVFRVREVGGGAPEDDPARWDPVLHDLRRVLNKEIRAADLIAHPEGRFHWPDGPPIETRATFDQRISETCTVVDVIARDRPGLLHAVVQVIADHDCSVELARITTEGDAVHDIFYVQTPDGQKLDDDRAATLVEAMAWAAEGPA